MGVALQNTTMKLLHWIWVNSKQNMNEQRVPPLEIMMIGTIYAIIKNWIM